MYQIIRNQFTGVESGIDEVDRCGYSTDSCFGSISLLKGSPKNRRFFMIFMLIDNRLSHVCKESSVGFIDFCFENFNISLISNRVKILRVGCMLKTSIYKCDSQSILNP